MMRATLLTVCMVANVLISWCALCLVGSARPGGQMGFDLKLLVAELLLPLLIEALVKW